MKPKIILRKIHNYDLALAESFVRDCMQRFGVFASGERVLIKPNLLKAARPERCVTTHPVVLEAVCRVLRDCGVKQIDIGDSPALGSLEHVAHTAGYAPLVARYGARLVPFSNPIPLEIEEDIPHLKIAGNIFEYDRIINLPKFKSHQQMTLTLGIKNLFGCVIGKRKPVLHCLVKNDKVKFGRMLVDIASRINPSLTIVDGIQAMQGSGPMNGTPYPLGVLACGQDMTALERVLVEAVQVPVERVYVLEAARQRKFGACELADIEVVVDGGDFGQLVVSDFQLAEMSIDISFNPFRVMKSFLKQFYEIRIKEKIAG